MNDMNNETDKLTKPHFEDLTIICNRCGASFAHSAGAQDFFYDRFLNEPKKCPQCRLPKRLYPNQKGGA